MTTRLPEWFRMTAGEGKARRRQRRAILAGRTVAFPPPADGVVCRTVWVCQWCEAWWATRNPHGARFHRCAQMPDHVAELAERVEAAHRDELDRLRNDEEEK